MTENGLGTNRRRANTISLNERRVTWETCEQNDLVRRKQNRPKRHLNDAARDVLFACEVESYVVGMENWADIDEKSSQNILIYSIDY